MDETTGEMTPGHALALGVLQGLGEFLPISSSGHLIVVPWLLGWPVQSLAFDVALHVGTLAAVLYAFVGDWAPHRAVGHRRRAGGEAPRGVGRPAAGAAGGGVHPRRRRWACCSTTGRRRSSARRCWWRWTWRCWGWSSSSPTAARPRAASPDDSIDSRGGTRCSSASPRPLALVPGVSRSGATISMALFLGYERRGGGPLQLPARHADHRRGRAPARCRTCSRAARRQRLDRDDRPRRSSGLLSIRVLLAYVKTRTYRPFVYYRWAFAAVVLVASFVRAELRYSGRHAAGPDGRADARGRPTHDRGDRPARGRAHGERGRGGGGGRPSPLSRRAAAGGPVRQGATTAATASWSRAACSPASPSWSSPASASAVARRRAPAPGGLRALGRQRGARSPTRTPCGRSRRGSPAPTSSWTRCSGPACARRPRGRLAAARSTPSRALAAAGIPVVAVDLPSGVPSDAGEVAWPAVRGDAHRDLRRAQARPRAAAGLRPRGRAGGGRHRRSPRSAIEDAGRARGCSRPRTPRAAFPRRPRAAHKGTFGHVLVIGGVGREDGGGDPRRARAPSRPAPAW